MLYSFEGKTPRISPDTYVSDSAEIIGDVTVGPRCYIGPGAVIRGDAVPITIDEETAVEDGVIIHAGGAEDHCHIGKRVTIGHAAVVHSLEVGDGVSIGISAVLSLGSIIGKDSIIGECALVPKKHVVPEKSLVAGVPAKPLRELSEKDISIWSKTKDYYVELVARYLAEGSILPVKRDDSE